MDWLESIKRIQQARENNQLVVFVGAGVSQNSGIPTWNGLINAVAKKIGYSKCVGCKSKEELCPKDECKIRYEFSQNDLLRIPEYYFHQDTSKGHSEYYNFIQETLRSDAGPNQIDDEIFAVLPHHIITTNYDSLLEQSTEVNSLLYTTVTRDSDLLSNASERYIIKMHGDLESPETIVLKESDYLNYEQEHPLISTFIRALLVNHTFLFLGYTLNDNNLNLIISWINYFRKQHGVENRPANFLLSSKSAGLFEQSRLADRNIYVIDLNTLPGDLESKIKLPDTLTHPTGRRLLSYLRCITNPDLTQQYTCLEDRLTTQYDIFKSYKKISYQDLMAVCSLGPTKFMDTQLVFYDKSWYDDVAQILKNYASPVAEVFCRAGISEICYSADNLCTPVPNAYERVDDLFELYLDNNFIELQSRLSTCSDAVQKLYYSHLLGYSKENIEKLLDRINDTADMKDYISVLMMKMRARIATLAPFDRQEAKRFEIQQMIDTPLPSKYNNATSFLRMLFSSAASNMQKMENILAKHEQRHEYQNRTLYSAHVHSYVWELKAFAYDYYFFFKENGLPLDYYSDPKEYLSYYLRAVLCTYSPMDTTSQNDPFHLYAQREPYKIGEVELDMLVKFAPPKNLGLWLKKYSVQRLILEDGIDIVKKFNFLCHSLVAFKIKRWTDALLNYSKIICLLGLGRESKQKLLDSLSDVMEYSACSLPQLGSEMIKTIEYFALYLNIEEGALEISRLMDAILSAKLLPTIKEQNAPSFERISKKWGKYASQAVKKRLTDEIYEIDDPREECQWIYFLRHVIPFENYCTFISTNISLLSVKMIFMLIIERKIQFSDLCWQQFTNAIREEEAKRESLTGEITFQDHLITAIHYCLLLGLIGCDVDFASLQPYAHYSEHLRFMISPETFDYSLVDTNNYMWQNLIYSKTYREYFVAHKNELLTEALKQTFDLELETRDQQKIVYGFLLDPDEVQGF